MPNRLLTRILSAFKSHHSRIILAAVSTILISFGPAERGRGGNDYAYSPYEKSDPFSPGLSFQSTPRALDPLQSVPLDQIAVVATIVGRSSSALVEIALPSAGEPKRFSKVKVGDRIGTKLGTIISIYKDRIVVREQLQGPTQDPAQRFQDVTMTLREGSGAPSSNISTRDISADSDQPKNITEALTQDVLPPSPENYGRSPLRGARNIQIFGSGQTQISGEMESIQGSTRTLPSIPNTGQVPQAPMGSGSPSFQPSQNQPSRPPSFTSPSRTPPASPIQSKSGPYSIERRSIAPNP